jgi:starch synthase
LKAGIALADAITTVSPTYAREIMTPDHGCGLDGLLRERAGCAAGIMNGVDYRIWDPGLDPHIARNYTALTAGFKALNKRAVQSELGLEVVDGKPLLAFTSRPVPQKMPDVVLDALPALGEEGMKFALVAEGESHFQRRFRELAESFPGSVAVRLGYDEVQAHRLLAGADILLHPSRFEPCGLVPIYAMRYGTIPVVRNCGGMADSVTDASASALQQGMATGFSFKAAEVSDLLVTVRRAHALYRKPIAWHRLRQTATQQDFSWRSRSAQAYADLYRSLANMPLRAQAPGNGAHR